MLAEAEDHLRESVAEGLAAGLSEREAQEHAVSSFGSVRAVVRAHDARLRGLPRSRCSATCSWPPGGWARSAWSRSGSAA